MKELSTTKNYKINYVAFDERFNKFNELIEKSFKITTPLRLVHNNLIGEAILESNYGKYMLRLCATGELIVNYDNHFNSQKDIKLLEDTISRVFESKFIDLNENDSESRKAYNPY